MAREYNRKGEALATFTTDSAALRRKRYKGAKVAKKAAKVKATPRKQGLLTDLHEKRSMTYQSVPGTKTAEPSSKKERTQTPAYNRGTSNKMETGGMFKAIANAEEAKQAAKMDTSVYKPTNITKSPYGDADLAGKGRRGTPKGNIGKVQQITEDTKYGGMQKNKQGTLKTPARVDKPKTKKRFRAGPTMTGMGGMRKSGTLRGKYVK